MKSNITSQVITDLRLPLAIMVVFIHSFGQPSEYSVLADANAPLDGFMAYDTMRILCSHVVSHIAVPTFFLISGYLFFMKAETLDWNFYKKQWQKRVRTLLVPYLLWNVVKILYILLMKCAGVIIKGKPVEGLTEYLRSVCTPQLFWEYNSWGGDRTTVLQQVTDPNTGPYLVPMWFIRDLICVVLIAPLLAWLLKKSKGTVLLILAAFYLLRIQSFVSDMFVTACFFFSIGAFFGIRKTDFAQFISRYTLPLLAVWLPLVCYNVYHDGANTDEGLSLYSLMVVTGVFFIIGWCARGYRLMYRWDYAARNTFFIFAAHSILGLPIASAVLRILSGYMPHSVLTMSIQYLATPFLAVAVCLLILYPLQRWLPRVAGVLTGER